MDTKLLEKKMENISPFELKTVSLIWQTKV